MYYEAIDRWNNGGPYLEHGFKYLKKISIGGHTRYFYTPGALKAYYNQLNKKSKQIDNGMARDIHDNTMDFIRDESHASKYGHLQSHIADEQMNAAKKAHRELKNKNNKIEALVNTSKFAAKNILGSKSKKDLEQRYNKSQVNDLKKHRKKAKRITKKMWTKMNEITSQARKELDW